MNSNDRFIINEIYTCLNVMSGMYPYNPADTKRKFEIVELVHKSAPLMMAGIVHMKYREYKEAEEALKEARQILRPNLAEIHGDFGITDWME